MEKKPPNHLIPPSFRCKDKILLETAKRFGTPLFVYDEDQLRQSWFKLREAVPDGVAIHYSVKANPSLGVIGVFAKLGANFEVSSKFELLAVTAAGGAAHRVIFVGPGKSAEELALAVFMGVGVVVAESPRELSLIDKISSKLGKRQRVALRLNPCLGEGAQKMGGVTQFGFEPRAIRKILKNPAQYQNLDISGIHGFLGTRLLCAKTLVQNMLLILDTAETLMEETGLELGFCDVGGGFGVPVYEGETALDLVELKSELAQAVGAFAKRHPSCALAVESGRFLAASSGVMVTRVLDVKKNFGCTFVVVDGGLHVLGGRDGYYGSRCGPFRILGDAGGKPCEITVCGPLCSPMDRLAVKVLSPKPKPGDHLAFYMAGAYGFSTGAGLYLSRGFPAEALITDSEPRLLRPHMDAEEILGPQRQLAHKPCAPFLYCVPESV